MTTETSIKPKKTKAARDAIRIAVVAAFFLGMAFLLKEPYVREELFNIDQIRARLRGMGWYSIVVFIGAAALVNALGIPRLWISAVAGSLYGAVQGTGIALVATLIGASANFLMGRSLLRGPITRRMPSRLRRWYDAFNRHGFSAILYCRLFPFTNATLTNLLGGASQMKFRAFLAATAIGFLPFTIAMAMLGSSAAKQSEWQLAFGLALFALMALGQWAYGRWKGKPEEEVPPA
jgi:uncharacterized membrane protein YdjX (TVP38/TMEM64 family)